VVLVESPVLESPDGFSIETPVGISGKNKDCVKLGSMGVDVEGSPVPNVIDDDVVKEDTEADDTALSVRHMPSKVPSIGFANCSEHELVAHVLENCRKVLQAHAPIQHKLALEQSKINYIHNLHSKFIRLHLQLANAIVIHACYRICQYDYLLQSILLFYVRHKLASFQVVPLAPGLRSPRS
jgi:hypothetical protein